MSREDTARPGPGGRAEPVPSLRLLLRDGYVEVTASVATRAGMRRLIRVLEAIERAEDEAAAAEARAGIERALATWGEGEGEGEGAGEEATRGG
jgi:hypothetical protein